MLIEKKDFYRKKQLKEISLKHNVGLFDSYELFRKIGINKVISDYYIRKDGRNHAGSDYFAKKLAKRIN